METRRRQGIRVSLGYRDLTEIDGELILAFGKCVTWLDLTGNRFGDDLSVLRSFPSLEVLVVDGNNITCHLMLAQLPKLHTLWMNNNKVDNTAVLLDHLVQVTPNLEEFSLLKNPACLNYFTGGSPKEYRDYRLYVINRLPNIRTLDGTPVTPEEHQLSTKVYGALAHTRAAKKLIQTTNSSTQTFQNSIDYSVAVKDLDLPQLRTPETPKQETKTPKKETKTPKKETKTPKKDTKTPKKDTNKDTKTDGDKTVKSGNQVLDLRVPDFQ